MNIFSKQKQANTLDSMQVINIPIEEGLICLRGLSPKRLRFELEYALERGSTDNSFLFTTTENSHNDKKEVILVHPPGAIYAEVFMPMLAKVLPKGNNLQKLSVLDGFTQNR